MGYNPADYAAVENKAKAMGKPELEMYYVKQKNDKYLGPGGLCGNIIIIGAVIFLIGVLGFLIGSEIVYKDLNEVSGSIADQVCPVADDVYISVDIGKTDYYDFEIDCSTYKQVGDKNSK